jgi:hypothetical protein
MLDRGGVWGAPRLPSGLIGGLIVLGAPHHPRSSTPLITALVDFITKADALRGPMSEMALLLFGATDETRGQSLKFRQTEAGKIEWEGRKVTWETARKKRQPRILKNVAQALLDAEIAARKAKPRPTGTATDAEVVEAMAGLV